MSPLPQDLLVDFDTSEFLANVPEFGFDELTIEITIEEQAKGVCIDADSLRRTLLWLTGPMLALFVYEFYRIYKQHKANTQTQYVKLTDSDEPVSPVKPIACDLAVNIACLFWFACIACFALRSPQY